MSKRHTIGAVVGVVLALTVLLVAAGCGSSSSASTTTSQTPATAPSTGSGATNVTIQNFAFTPQTLTVKAGTTVTWTNKDSVQHNIVSTKSIAASTATTSLYNSGLLGQGQTFSFTFSKPGTYFYECSIHATQPAMHATVIVQ
jgi:plastocyanin